MALVALILWTAACGSSSPAAPSSPPVTDTLTGTLSPTNANAHALNAAAAGAVTITLTTLTPAVPAVGLGVGVIANDGTCSVQLTNSPAAQGTVWNTTVTGSGGFCVVIYDIGLLTQAETYSITVVHP